MKDNLFFNIEKVNKEGLNFTIGAVNFKMVKVRGGTFTMGATEEQGEDSEHVCPKHRVILSDYYICQTEVTQELWEAVMNWNSSYFKGYNIPVTNIDFDDCNTFIEKLNILFSNELCGMRFALPTEAQWEFAARGGNHSKGYKYSGSNNIDDVAWYKNNSGSQTHPVAQKKPNELGLYDMSGNVYEWCQDWYSFSSYYYSEINNPKGPDGGDKHVIRGGSWCDNEEFSSSSFRYSCLTLNGFKSLGFRLCLNPLNHIVKIGNVTHTNDTSRAILIPFTVKGVTFNMVQIECDMFTMGYTDEQGYDAYNDERPSHLVTLTDSYLISQTLVTQKLWEVVIGNNPSKNKGDDLPVENVSWYDCQIFVKELNHLFSNELCGMRFALPTEAQWEFAARGGNKSKGYKYAGSNNIDDVAWYYDNGNSLTHPVAQKQPNELGLYDMSGNVEEWCQDWFDKDYYSISSEYNPKGPDYGIDRVIRGGYWFSVEQDCRVSKRGCFPPHSSISFIGLRLCCSKVN